MESIHRHCPDFQRKTLFADHEFTIKELKARSDYESYMLGLLKKEPSILYLIVVCDESTFVLHGRSKHCDCVQIYCSSEDVSVTDVCCISDLDQDPIKVHFFLAVTAHHTFKPRGVVMYAQCTGTTGINRYHNKHLDASSMVGDWTYQVSSAVQGIGLRVLGCYLHCRSQSAAAPVPTIQLEHVVLQYHVG